jgi:hypothetical protein
MNKFNNLSSEEESYFDKFDEIKAKVEKAESENQTELYESLIPDYTFYGKKVSAIIERTIKQMDVLIIEKYQEGIKEKSDAELGKMYNDLYADVSNGVFTSEEGLQLFEEISKETRRRLIERGQLPDPDKNPN